MESQSELLSAAPTQVALPAMEDEAFKSAELGPMRERARRKAARVGPYQRDAARSVSCDESMLLPAWIQVESLLPGVEPAPAPRILPGLRTTSDAVAGLLDEALAYERNSTTTTGSDSDTSFKRMRGVPMTRSGVSDLFDGATLEPPNEDGDQVGFDSFVNEALERHGPPSDSETREGAIAPDPHRRRPPEPLRSDSAEAMPLPVVGSSSSRHQASPTGWKWEWDGKDDDDEPDPSSPPKGPTLTPTFVRVTGGFDQLPPAAEMVAATRVS